jgi:hypothetical protein
MMTPPGASFMLMQLDGLLVQGHQQVYPFRRRARAGPPPESY